MSFVELTGHAKLERRIARDGADGVAIEVHRTLPPVLERIRAARPGTGSLSRS
jgi:hypothetical protein